MLTDVADDDGASDNNEDNILRQNQDGVDDDDISNNNFKSIFIPNLDGGDGGGALPALLTPLLLTPSLIISDTKFGSSLGQWSTH